ncbi:PA domain-containing protein [Psidium guajava]|nr:PA domain-containing protein [Psidium guajava]
MALPAPARCRTRTHAPCPSARARPAGETSGARDHRPSSKRLGHDTTMTNGDGGWSSSSSSSRAVSGNVYVALGSDAADSETALSWALQNFGGEFKYCILHVRQPGRQLDPPGNFCVPRAGKMLPWKL